MKVAFPYDDGGFRCNTIGFCKTGKIVENSRIIEIPDDVFRSESSGFYLLGGIELHHIVTREMDVWVIHPSDEAPENPIPVNWKYEDVEVGVEE